MDLRAKGKQLAKAPALAPNQGPDPQFTRDNLPDVRDVITRPVPASQLNPTFYISDGKRGGVLKEKTEGITLVRLLHKEPKS